MHRVVAGCNLWALAFLVAAGVLGARGSSRHVPFAMFAAIFALLAQSAIFALFMGASKLLKEHVRLYALPDALVARTNAILLPLFRRASLGALALLLQAILGGLAASGDVPAALHVGAALAALALVAAVLPGEVRGLAAMHGVLADMEALVPAPVAPATAAPPVPAAAAGELPPHVARARALVYVGSTVLVLALGYRFVAGLPVPDAVLAAAAVLGTGCLALAARARRAGPG